MNVLVTGGAGFLGTYVMAALLAAGNEAVAYDLAPPNPEMLHVVPDLAGRCRLGTIDDVDGLVEACRAGKVDAIVHAAGRVGQLPSVADPAGFYRANIMGMVNACEAARQAGVGKVVMVSSNSVYHGANGGRLTETDLPFSITRANPAAHYGTSKMAGEAIGMAYADFHDIDFLALRISAIYGFGMRVPLLIKPMVENAVLGAPTRLPTGGLMKRDYTHVLDCSRAILCAVKLPRLGRGAQRVLNVAAGHLRTGAEVADTVRRAVPGADIEISDAFTPLEQENVKTRAPLDSSAAGRLLGWWPEWSIEDGVPEYVGRFRAYVGSQAVA